MDVKFKSSNTQCQLTMIKNRKMINQSYRYICKIKYLKVIKTRRFHFNFRFAFCISLFPIIKELQTLRTLRASLTSVDIFTKKVLQDLEIMARNYEAISGDSFIFYIKNEFIIF